MKLKEVGSYLLLAIAILFASFLLALGGWFLFDSSRFTFFDTLRGLTPVFGFLYLLAGVVFMAITPFLPKEKRVPLVKVAVVLFALAILIIFCIAVANWYIHNIVGGF